jgi:uncharacterized protein (UPF0332 family)
MNSDIIKYRRKRAKEALLEAEIMLENNKLSAAVNRILQLNRLPGKL